MNSKDDYKSSKPEDPNRTAREAFRTKVEPDSDDDDVKPIEVNPLVGKTPKRPVKENAPVKPTPEPDGNKTNREVKQTKKEIDFYFEDDSSSSLAIGATAVERKEGGGDLFVPQHRPRTPLLYVLDDDQSSAEIYRLRKPRCLIGRNRGDIVVANDPHMSERHAEIQRVSGDFGYAWEIHDLKSTNGTFVRIQRWPLSEGDCILLGQRYFRFCRIVIDTEVQNEGEKPIYGLIEYATKDADRNYRMSDSSYTIGRERKDSDGMIWDDPTLDDEHATIECDAQGNWTIQDCNSRNGTWVRMENFELSHGVGFQLGGQRFVFVQADID